ncbi:MAG: DNA polymerase III subunit delta' [Thiovulaceae bacterium]|nr:DNA polymerase III subunit delta' [Sulfurimonadaceae bacterium]
MSPIKGHILISTDIQKEFQKFQVKLQPNRVIGFVEDVFKLEHAKAVVAESYISENMTKYLILGSKSFGIEAQNSLLKVLEEPPNNIEFIIISPTKSNLLPTVRSRLPIIKGEISHESVDFNLNLSKIEYADIFAFLKSNARISKVETKELVEAIYHRATVVDKLILNESQLNNFDKAYRLLELNSRPQSILAFILMGFIHAS